MNELPPIHRAHLEAITGDAPATVRDVWEPDGVLEFPYAPADSPNRRLEGADAIVAYFDGPRRFRGWTFTDVRAGKLEGADEHVVELHGSATLIATGAPYEQDYVVRFAVAPSGRLAWMREYWNPAALG
jgi:uncharacterized protein